MPMINVLAGYLTGLSVGVFCLGLCLPIILPLLLSEKRDLKKSLFVFLEFSLGRLLGYFIFGLTFGWFGQKIQIQSVHTTASLVNLWMGILLILYSLGKIDKKICALLPFKKIRWPFLIGFLTGVNVCPPLMASLTYVFNLRSALRSLFYFLAFFLGTTTYLLPAAFFGVLTKSAWIPKAARVSGVLAGIYFIVRNLILIF